MEEKKCVFCSIVSGEIQSHKVFEDQKFVAVLDIFPITPGHTVVFPKKHYDSFFKIPSMDRIQLFETVARVADAVLKGVDTDSFNLFVFEGKNANKTIFHEPQIHIVPRFANDGLNFNPPRGRYAEGQADQVYRKIARFLKG
ncbi:MAG: HIT domain-containing protein [Candidatus Aenigmatarchaeota archaeon]|nr:HIT domain-containing protein [Candidatus Aenigmarchaeota archaeon]